MPMREEWWTTIDPARTAFFLDVDGTLLGFKSRPEDVLADPDLLDLLERLRDAAGGALALVSGRKIADLDRIMAPLHLPAGGVHGAEIRFADQRRESFDNAALGKIRDAARDFVEANDGLRLEDKGATIAIHYRQAPSLAGPVRSFLEAAIVEPDLMVQHGKMVAEVKSIRCHKGLAIATLMREPPFVGRRPLFIGDDLTDEYGFATVNELEGISIKVAPSDERTVARYTLADLKEVRDFLYSACRTAPNIRRLS